ncbi:hypothetical protein E3N88_44517 [Mikania micrantha]|uniref:Uncharacterized protein n=1 Tax=Mikania micrantha TaxID=192012 RepID=A0A5N6LCF4_9ASTR|nr:hypothetical protein E3N88_44517 [Mikania micrantha]
MGGPLCGTMTRGLGHPGSPAVAIFRKLRACGALLARFLSILACGGLRRKVVSVPAKWPMGGPSRGTMTRGLAHPGPPAVAFFRMFPPCWAALATYLSILACGVLRRKPWEPGGPMACPCGPYATPILSRAAHGRPIIWHDDTGSCEPRPPFGLTRTRREHACARSRHGGTRAWGRNEAHCGALMAPLALCTWQLAVDIYAARAQLLGQDMRHMDGPSNGTLT